MDKIKSILSEAKNRIAEKMESGLDVYDIPEMAEMISSVDILECYLNKAEKVPVTDESPQLIKDIEDKLKSGESYLNVFSDKGDRDFIQMAFDELSHSAKFISIAKENGYDIINYQERLNDLQERISRS